MASSIYNFKPLRIVARMGSSVAGDTELPIDGVLWYQHCREKLGANPGPNVPGRSFEIPASVTDSFPIEWRGEGEDRYPAASFARWQIAPGKPLDYQEWQEHFNKRFDTQFANLIDFKGKRANIITGQGRYKSYHVPNILHTSLFLEWYLVGDKATISRYLANVVAIGKDRRMGYGDVLAWAISDWSEDWSVIGPDKEVMRAVPPQAAAGAYSYGFGYRTIRPPYWDGAAIRAILPISNHAYTSIPEFNQLFGIGGGASIITGRRVG